DMQIWMILHKPSNYVATNKARAACDDNILFTHEVSKLLCSKCCLREKFVLLRFY
ncbi:MAG: hypothetical protein RIS28_1552, partial [Bacteroidota bacterium]